MFVKFQSSYISCGCNKLPHAADWGKNGLICFGSCNSVIVYDPKWSGNGGKIIHTLHGHKDRVNSVRWLKNNLQTYENQFISASVDKTAILWTWNENKENFVQSIVLTGHNSTVNVADGFVKKSSNSLLTFNESSVFLATSSIDSTVMIWESTSSIEKFKCIEKLKWTSGFCLDVKLSVFPETNILLVACSADDNNVHIFAECQKSEIDKMDNDCRFEKIFILTGHEDWVRSLDIVINGLDLYLATGSQDTYIRILKFERRQELKTNCFENDLNSKDWLEHDKKIIAVGSTFSKYYFAVILETILAGHEGWIYGVSWHPLFMNYTHETAMNRETDVKDSAQSKRLKLLSSSMDKTIIIWSPDDSGIWAEEARVGEVGGNMLGFYGGKFSPDGKSIMGHGYQGSFHIWSVDENKGWQPQIVVGGHTSEVRDIAWDVQGNYVISVGGDQTARLHAPWLQKDAKKLTWHEIARPQIHGYDLTCVAVLSPYKYVSGAEEKVIRVFTAPNNFVENFKRICSIKEDPNEVQVKSLPLGASVPALGLSNKPVFEQMKKEGFLVDNEIPDLYFSPIHLTEPPTEDNLMQNTLWPEALKLYGHGYEIYSLAARHDGIVLASACKATSAENATIILWNVKTWLQIQKLSGHQLTVTQMSFSPNGKYLLSVSRDRKWCLFSVKEDGKSYELIATSDIMNNFHSRVIWCCAWTSDSLNFATGSRDGKIGVWNIEEQSDQNKKKVIVNLTAELELSKESVTALAFAPVTSDEFYILAVGLEAGEILLYELFEKFMKPLNITVEGTLKHDLAVKRLAFRPIPGRAGFDVNVNSSVKEYIFQLASCGSDHAVKIFDLFLNSRDLS